MRKIIKMRQHKEKPKKIRVAAYARVSRETDRTNHSLAAQVSYYSEHIQSNPDWEYAGVYIDSFVTGTKTSVREGFNELIADCEIGKIDLVLVKSISRFARNTVDLLNVVRRLKDIGVAVCFEKERINTLSSDGEFLLTVLASFAQEEITSISNNIKWAFKRKFQQGIPIHHHKVLGYDWHGDELKINEAEAEIVCRVFNSYLSGSSTAELARELTAEYPELNFSYSRVAAMLSNEKYKGMMVLQKTYSANPITKKTKVNKGELPFYIVDDHHEPIIDKVTFEAVQTEKQRRAELGAIANKYINTSCLTGKIKCGCCGSNYIKDKRIRNGAAYWTWNCRKRVHGNAAACSGRIVPDNIIKDKFSEVCGQEFSEDLFDEVVSEVIVLGTDRLEFHFKDGGTAFAQWELTGNKDRWTDEERRKKSEYAKAHPINNGNTTCLTSKIQCGCCGENFRRHYIKSSERYSWGCATGKKVCGIRWIRDEEIKRILTEVLDLDEFNEKIFAERVDHIVILSNEELTVCFKDGLEQTVPWNSKRVKREDANHAKNSKSDSSND